MVPGKGAERSFPCRVCTEVRLSWSEGCARAGLPAARYPTPFVQANVIGKVPAFGGSDNRAGEGGQDWSKSAGALYTV